MGTTPWHRFDGRGDVPPGAAGPPRPPLKRVGPPRPRPGRGLPGRDAIGERAIAHA